MKNIAALLEYQRKKLLDTSRQTPLLNYRPTNKAIEITSEWPQEIFYRLVNQQKSLVLLAQSEDEFGESLETSQHYTLNLLDEESVDTNLSEFDDAFHLDEHFENALRWLIKRGRLLTNHDADDLKKRVSSIYKDIRRFNRELGVNPYYLTIGILEWFDPKRSQDLNQAPLLLIPIEITQKNRFADFEVRYTDEEIEFNRTLYEKLQEDFGIQLPSPAITNLLDIQSYFTSIEDAVFKHGWKVDKTKIVLTVFAFRKFLMHTDLKIDSWPAESSPEKNSTINKLIKGHLQKSSAYSFQHTHYVDSITSSIESCQICDADSSQSMAIYHVKNGHDLIIQGPPGTGKSQTITNIIAQAIGNNKTVLFVAQKETALKAVKSRLDEAKLGQLYLELHGPRTKRGSFLKDIQETLDSSKVIKAQHLVGNPEELISLQGQLNSYCEVLNTPIDKEIITPFQCFEELLRLKPILQVANPPKWPDKNIFIKAKIQQYHEWLPKVESLQRLLAEIGTPKDNVFRFCQYSEDTFVAPEQTRQIIGQTQIALKSLEEGVTKLATHLGIPSPTTKRQTKIILSLSQHILQCPPLDGIDIHSDKWRSNAKKVLETIDAIRHSDELQRKYNKILVPEAWTRSITDLQEQIQNNSTTFQRLFNLPAKVPDSFAELCLNEPPKNIKGQLSILEAISNFQSHCKLIQERESLLKELLGEKIWSEKRADWKYLSNLLNWLNGLYQQIQVLNVPSSIIDYLKNEPKIDILNELCQIVENNLNSYEITVSFLVKQLLLDEASQFGKGHTFSSLTYEAQNKLLSTWFTNVGQLKDIVDYKRLKGELVRAGFASVVELGEIWLEAKTYLTALMKYMWYLYLINQHRKGNPLLISFNRVTHETKIQKFGELDKAILEENKSGLVSDHNEAVIGLTLTENPEIERQLRLIKSQCINPRSRLSIREIMENAGKAIQVLKPLFMMSPDSVAKFLPPGAIKFDLVIFDEASQIKPEDALGAILRGNQTVVVGDRHQLPPTEYFKASVSSNDLEDALDAESVLDFFAISGAPETTLLWHYRSQHHSLIAPSNHEFYNNELVAFPSSQIRNEKLGVRFSYISGSVYDRGKDGTRTNLVEARHVASAVMHHAQNDPHLSLGVVALNKEQAEAIEHEINLLRDQIPNCEYFFQEEDRFFVTNLESVQGDERDVIFISIGFGFSRDGRLTLQFGPISQQGGERRLNVLTTRARRQCVVFSSIRGRDIYERNPSNRGAQFLAQYLEYAEKGIIRGYEEAQLTLQTNENYIKTRERLPKLISILNEKFTIDELRTFCVHLDNIDLENIPGDTRSAKARELVFHFERRKSINQLIQVGKQHRPDITEWGELDIDHRSLGETTNEDSTLQMEKLDNPFPSIKDSFLDKGKSSYSSFQILQIEEEVAEVLQARGYCIERQVGPPNAAIPIAVIDEKEKVALLGIEFDGPSYYQARSARDRDRLRQQELRKLKWNIHRIWIIDWYYNKERELERLIKTIKDIQLQR